MRQNPPLSPAPASTNVKYLFYQSGDAPGVVADYVPFFYVEARVDFNDIRTGFRSMVSLNKALEFHPIGLDLSLVADMVYEIDPQRVKSSPPPAARYARLPEFVDPGFMSQMETQFIRYLLNSFKAKVYRNSVLDAYSDAGESLPDFTARCMDLLGGARREDLDALHDVFNRKLGQIEQKYLTDTVPENFELAKTASQGRDIFSDYLERIAHLFLQPKPVPESDGFRSPRSGLEMEERLQSLETEAQQAIAALWDSYGEKAKSVDEYILHPNLKDVHIVRTCILWIPARVG
ncbi:MAG TPA: hypothetical protein VMG30_16570 [Acidobacteriota bacterium]|nr:hypothetical protein [Acidobacteriota bacterium]